MMQRHGEHKNLRKKRGTARSYMRRILAGLCCGAIVFGTVLDRNLTTSYGAGETEKGEALIKFPTAGNMEKPSGYEKVEFQNTRFQSKPGEVTVSGNPRVIFWVKSGTTWGQVASDPSFYLPETNTAAGEFLLSWARNGNYPADAFDKEGLSATPITGDWIFSATVDDLVQEKTDNVGFENFISKTYAAVDRPKFRGITLDADGGTMNGISGKYIVVHKDVTYDNAALQKILEASMPQKEGNEFVRWQTDANQVLPKTGTIATQTYKALYIKYPEKKVSVFNKAQLGAREKEAVERAVREANAATAGLFREVKVSEDGAVIVTY
ncbi:MAG: hypothetical protein SPL15_02715, partial [Lachnospiraceae bacterium]|nr:hypothetical protein [Lachnospiraceae bacterium]